MTPSLCLEMLFTDRPFVERMRAAAGIGYRAIEFWEWRDKELDAVADAARDLGLEVATFSGNRRWGLVDPAHRPGLLDELAASVAAAARLGCRRLMLLTDPLAPDGSAVPSPGAGSAAARLASTREGLAEAAQVAGERGVMLLLEPLNTVLDHRGYSLDRSAAAFDVVRAVGSPQVRVLYDCYHMSMMGEDVPAALAAGFPWLGYVHVADAPGRHEPGTGRVDYPGILATLRRLGYAEPVGLEFSPAGSSEAAARRALALFPPPGSAA